MKRKLADVLLRILPPGAAVLIVAEIIVVNQFAGVGQAIAGIDRSIDTLQYENSLLGQQIASASSLMTIAVKSKEIGFVEPAKSQYRTIVPDQLPVALQNPR